jgi:hypothetical protein
VPNAQRDPVNQSVSGSLWESGSSVSLLESWVGQWTPSSQWVTRNALKSRVFKNLCYLIAQSNVLISASR